MAKTKQVNLRLPVDVIEKYEQMAIDAEDRDRSYFMKKAIIGYVDVVAEKKPVKAVSPQKQVAEIKSDDADLVIDYLNLRAGTKYKHAASSRDAIRPRLDEFSLQDCYTVIDKKCAEWMGTEQQRYLRPSTLFQRSKFEGYLNQVILGNQKQQMAQQRDQEVNDWVNGRDSYTSGETIDNEPF